MSTSIYKPHFQRNMFPKPIDYSAYPIDAFFVSKSFKEHITYNKYCRWYFDICIRAHKDRAGRFASKQDKTEYYEAHHIVPASIDKINPETLKRHRNVKVLLTAREHYIVHVLLTKFTMKRARHLMLYAFNAMTKSRTKGTETRYTSNLYKRTKEAWAKTHGANHSKKMKAMYARKKAAGIQHHASGRVWSDKQKELWSKQRKGGNNPRARSCLILGLFFDSVIEAYYFWKDDLDVGYSGFLSRITSKKQPDYEYLLEAHFRK